MEQENAGLKKDVEDLELAIQKSDQDKASKDHQIRNLNDEIAHQDELINKLNKEKKLSGETAQKTAEELQVSVNKTILISNFQINLHLCIRSNYKRVSNNRRPKTKSTILTKLRTSWNKLLMNWKIHWNVKRN